jgi:dihydrolipoamide dehydrogenase
VAEILAGKPGHVNYDTIPGVVYTWPEAASVGATEEQLKNQGIAYNKGKFPFSANGRAAAMSQSAGFVKILAEKQYDRVLGVHILGPWASDLIQEAVVLMEFGGSAEDLARTVHPHPTLSEAVREAALDVDGRMINM